MNCLFVITLIAMVVMSVSASPVDEKEVCLAKFRSALDKQFEMPADVDTFVKGLNVDWSKVLVGEVDPTPFREAAKASGRPDAGCELFDEFTEDDDLDEAMVCFERNQFFLDDVIMGEDKIKSFWQGTMACAASLPEVEDVDDDE